MRILLLPALVLAATAASAANDNYDLDDIRAWPTVKMETCLDAALDTIPGHPRKLEMKLEGDDPVYEFDIESADGTIYNVECNAEEGFVTEIERQVAKTDEVFRSLAKITEEQARSKALSIHPGTIVASEYEIGFNGVATYEFDIQSPNGYEIKVDVNATSGEIEEANIELYEIGPEQE